MDGVDSSWTDVFQGLTLGVGGALVSRLNSPNVSAPSSSPGNPAAAPVVTGMSGLNTQGKLSQIASNPFSWLLLGLLVFGVYKLARR